ncbi:MAG: hypothetical protein K2H46_03890 [Muribaculaceae bacterium]|nr:hypothetical protein [Muribaculaceae bacterium]
MATIKLTPMQEYLYKVYQALNSGVSEAELMQLLMARPCTLKSAISAAFYKSVGISANKLIPV